MNVIILHCHYERGGVTQVAENHVWALRESGFDGRIVLASGPRQGGLSEMTRAATEQIVIEGIDYDPPGIAGGSANRRGRMIEARLREHLADLGCSPANTLLHWHNHSLGKNTAAPAAIRCLAADRWRLLLQIHDFAEDNRPENYGGLIHATGASEPPELDRFLYPVAAQIHYATLTRGDASVLTRLGVPPPRLHWLPNSVAKLGEAAGSCGNGTPHRDQALSQVRRCFDLPATARWCLYPVRGIRRKNVGEFLLLCRWLPADMFGGLTLRPTTPVEAASYRRWKQVAGAVAPRTIFDAAHHPEISYPLNLAASEFVISTSVAEGFGMAFLEPWLAGRGVIARRIPSATDDFADAGLRFDSLYRQIPVPGSNEWLRAARDDSARANRAAFSGLPEAFRPAMPSRMDTSSDSIDFAQLTPERQVDVLECLARDPGFEAETKQRSASLIERMSQTTPPEVVEHNRSVIEESFSLARQGEQLRSIYEAVIGSDADRVVDGCEHAGQAVELVARTHPFFPCRTETLAGDGGTPLA